MKHSNAVPIEVPFSLPRPVSIDDVKPIRPNVFLFQPGSAANANRQRPQLRGRSEGAPLRIANRCGALAGLIDTWIAGRRPEYEHFYTHEAEAFYEAVCREGADAVFLFGGYLDSLNRLKLDPLLCDIPVIMVDSYDMWTPHIARDRYLSAGADAVIFVPIDEASVFGALDIFLPPYRPAPK